VLALLAAAWPAAAGPAPRRGERPAPPEEAAGADTDPTKPVIFSLRDELSNLRGDAWQNAFILRADAAILQRQVGARGLILRADVPLVTLHTPVLKATGLGDIYGQALVVVQAHGPLFLALGSGLQPPTATSRALGTGKWILAPAVIPVVFVPKRGLAYVKVQDWFSFAGDSGRPDVHFLTVTPTLLWRLTRRLWTLVDLESRTDWEGGSSWAKAGVLLGAMVTRRSGISLKAELPFGDQRPGDWTLKAVFFITRF
jgi:hypothetical protein